MPVTVGVEEPVAVCVEVNETGFPEWLPDEEPVLVTLEV